MDYYRNDTNQPTWVHKYIRQHMIVGVVSIKEQSAIGHFLTNQNQLW